MFNQKRNKINNNGGFSLVELLATVTVMAVLAVIAVPLYGSYTESAAEAADATYINEGYRAAAVVVASKNTTFDAIAYLPDGTMAVSHTLNDDTIDLATDTATAAGKYSYCGGCSSAIAEIIGGMQKFQSDAISKSANQFAGNTVDTGIGTLTFVEGITVSGNQYDAWVFEPSGTFVDGTAK